MFRSTFRRTLLPAVLILLTGLVACSDNDTTTSPGAIASINVNAPDTATNGQSFTVDVNATAVGISGVHNGFVNIAVPAPLAIMAVDPEAGTTASFSAGSASWNLGTLDANTNSVLHLTIMGTLPNGSSGQLATITATLTADGISAGEAVASDSVQVNP
jgi:hypothetical protein